MGAEELVQRVRADGLLRSGAPVVTLVSGGRDSICLLDVAARVCGPPAVCALHVNYGLRDAAELDEQHCAEACERAGVPLEIRRPVRPRSGNLQDWAREVRYAAAGELADARDADVAAGHTATDQVETILYRLATSPSRRALLGMRPRERRLVRPLLSFTREQTAAYCAERGLPWREDETNELASYARGRIRAGLVPALRTIHPAAERNVLALAGILRDEAEVLDALVDELLGGRQQIPLARLLELPLALRRLVVQRLADAAVGRPAPGTARRVQDICALGDPAALDLPHGVRALVQDGTLRFVRTPKHRARPQARP
jgi:tRNA(Ile)-lysidine synthase